MSQCQFYSFYEILYTINSHPHEQDIVECQVFVIINDIISDTQRAKWKDNLDESSKSNVLNASI